MTRHDNDEEKCAEALGEFVDLLNAGTAPSVDMFVLRYPDLESRLRPALEAALILHDAFDIARRRPPEADHEK